MKNKYKANELKLTNTIAMVIFMAISIFIVWFVYYRPGTFLQGTDFNFHHTRVDWLVESIQTGNVSPINYNYLDEKGYATGIFYPDIFLYPIALLKVAGLTYAQSYMIYFVGQLFIGMAIPYYAFKVIKSDNRMAFLFAILYGLAAYKTENMIRRTTLGEMGAMTFMPLIVVGLHNLIYGDQKKAFLIYFGMVGIIYSHMISAFVMALFIGIMLIANYKDLFKKKIIQKLTVIVVLTTLTALFILLPIFEQSRAATYKYSSTPITYVTNHQIPIQNLVVLGFANDAFTLGTIPLIGFLYLLFYKIKEDKIVKTYIIVGLIIMFIMSNKFPWWIIAKTPLNAIQFPFRLVPAVILSTSFVITYYFSSHKKINKVVTIITLFTLIFTMSQMMDKRPPGDTSIIQYNEIEQKSNDSSNIGWGEEYLPKNAKVNEIMNHPDVAINDDIGNNVEITEYKRIDNEISFKYHSNDSGENVIIPFVYYKGYEFEDSNKNNNSQVTLDQKYGTYVNINVKGEGEIKVKYRPTLIQRVTLVISSLTFIIYFVYLVIKNYKKKNQNEEVNEKPIY